MFALSKVRQSRNRKRICCADLADGHQGSALCLCMGCFHVQTGLFEGSYLKISLASAAVWLAASGFGHAEVDRQACMAARTDSEVLTPLNGDAQHKSPDSPQHLLGAPSVWYRRPARARDRLTHHVSVVSSQLAERHYVSAMARGPKVFGEIRDDLPKNKRLTFVLRGT